MTLHETNERVYCSCPRQSMLSKLKSGVQVTSGLEVVLTQEESPKATQQGIVTGYPLSGKEKPRHRVRVRAACLWGAQRGPHHLSHLWPNSPDAGILGMTLPAGQASCLELVSW